MSTHHKTRVVAGQCVTQTIRKRNITVYNGKQHMRAELFHFSEKRRQKEIGEKREVWKGSVKIQTKHFFYCTRWTGLFCQSVIQAIFYCVFMVSPNDFDLTNANLQIFLCFFYDSGCRRLNITVMELKTHYALYRGKPHQR